MDFRFARNFSIAIQLIACKIIDQDFIGPQVPAPFAPTIPGRNADQIAYPDTDITTSRIR